MTSDNRGFRLLGIGAAACVACCAGPILAFLGGLGVAGLASTFVIGGVGLVVTAAAVAASVVVRRRPQTCAVAATDVSVHAPVRRTHEPTEIP